MTTTPRSVLLTPPVWPDGLARLLGEWETRRPT
jgi:hypothetical protein